jgi:hypothetical protein
MLCLNEKCRCKLTESNLPLTHKQGWYIQNYYCFCCNTLYNYFSKNEDMSQGKLMSLDKNEY